MRRYTIEVDGRSFVVDVDEQGADHYAVVVDGQAYRVALAADEALADDGALRITPASAGPAAPATAAVPRAARPASLPRAATTAAGALGAPMPGVILRVLVAPGAQVRRGQDLAVLEAMKMENMIRAPADGTVAEVCVQPGQQLAHGEVILRFEAAPP
jgi:glutaconyl-CoA/methylmalonyl-CoA decarboxylase subunit gamma